VLKRRLRGIGAFAWLDLLGFLDVSLDLGRRGGSRHPLRQSKFGNPGPSVKGETQKTSGFFMGRLWRGFTNPPPLFGNKQACGKVTIQVPLP
jgi:hypothetical protein